MVDTLGGLVSTHDIENKDPQQYSSYGALSYICTKHSVIEIVNVVRDTMMISGFNDDNGKIEVMFLC